MSTRHRQQLRSDILELNSWIENLHFSPGSKNGTLDNLADLFGELSTSLLYTLFFEPKKRYLDTDKDK